jgi:hypothetical protein
MIVNTNFYLKLIFILIYFISIIISNIKNLENIAIVVSILPVNKKYFYDIIK